MTTDQHDVAALEERLRYLAECVKAHADKFPVPSHMIAHAGAAIEAATALARLRAERDEARAEAFRQNQLFIAAEAERDKLAARLELACVAAAAPVAPAGWRLIDGDDPAPKDGTIVDLWLLSRKTGEGRREPDCGFSQSQSWPYWINKSGKWVTGKRYMDLDGDWRCDPGCADEDSIVATHWRPRPAAPTCEGEGR